MKRLPREWRGELDGSLLVGAAQAIVRPARPLLRLAGLDLRRFDELLRGRLALDLKGDPRAPRSSGATVVATLAILGTMTLGVLVGLTAFFDVGPVLFGVLVQSAAAGVVGMILLFQLAGILIDPTDVEVLTPLPVDGREVLASRIAHAFAYVAVLAVSFSAAPALFGALGMRAWQPLLVVLLSTLLTSVLVLALVALALTLILRLVGAARFQRVALVCQIVAMLLLMGGAQALVGLSRSMLPQDIDAVALASAARWFPPFHQGELLAYCLGEPDVDLVAAGLALALPALAALLVLRVASVHFVAALSGRAAHVGAERERWPAGLGARLARAVTRTPRELAGFGQGWALSGRDPLLVRGGWMTVASLVGPVVGLGIGVARPDDPGTVGTIGSLGVLVVSYLMLLLGLSVTQLAPTTSTPEARWIYRALPGVPGAEHLTGVLLAILLRFVVPPVLVVAALQLVFLGPGALADVLLAGSVVLTGTVWFATRAKHSVPFSWIPRTGHVDLRNLPLVFGALGAAALGAGVHALLWIFAPGWVRAGLALAGLLALRRIPAWLREVQPEPLAPDA